jgi:hypothetical protein
MESDNYSSMGFSGLTLFAFQGSKVHRRRPDDSPHQVVVSELRWQPIDRTESKAKKKVSTSP